MNQNKEVVNIRLDEILPNRFQPRLTFNEVELQELAESIKQYGVIQPLVLRKIGDKYEIIAGERRYKASQMAGLQSVPAIITDLDDKQSAEVALVENLQRADLTAIEEAQSYKKLLDMGYTQDELAKKMGLAQSTVANKLRLLNLSIPVKDALLNNKISERHARSLLNLNDPNLQISMLNRIMSERLTVKQTDEEIAKLTGKAPQSAPIGVSFDVNVNAEKANSEDIIKEYKPNDIDMLLKPQSEVTNNPATTTTQKEEVAINPFQEVEPEIMDFEFEKPATDAPIESTNGIIEEFRSKDEVELVITEEPKTISKAITSARSEIKNLQNMGFEVETEEFDFEDMYQIIIKIKKD